MTADVIGGEFYYGAEPQCDAPSVDTSELTFLSGGKGCLSVICRWLLSEGIGEILLPEYICPTVVDTLEHWGLGYDFYGINDDLSFDQTSFQRQAEQFQTVLFVNYFGFSPKADDLALLREIQSAGKWLIEDNAQRGFWTASMGDFVFNSLRKVVPYDGGYLYSRFDVGDAIPAAEKPSRRLATIREYRRRLAAYHRGEDEDFAELTNLYETSERLYGDEYSFAGDAEEQTHIERLDWRAMQDSRRENYRILYAELQGVSGLTLMLPPLTEDAVPLGLPVYVRSIRRDALCERLAESGVGVTIHWEGLDSDPRFPWDVAAKPWSSRMLTLPVDQRHDAGDMRRLAKLLREILGEA